MSSLNFGTKCEFGRVAWFWRRPSVPQLAVLLAVLSASSLCLRGIEPEEILVLKAGPVSIKPQVAVSEVYNDNIFYLPQNEVQDFITTISPGLKLQIGKPEKNYLLLGYTYDQLHYAENSVLDAGQHNIDFRNKIEGERFSLIGSDGIQFLSSPLGGVERVLTARNIERNTFDDRYTAAYDISEKTGVYIRGSHNSVDYNEGIRLYDVETITGTGGFLYRVFPKTVLFGELYYGQTTTDPNEPSLPGNPEVRFLGGYIGVRGNFTQKLNGSIKVGYESREFSDRSSAPSEPVVDLSLTHRFSEKTSLALSYSRQNNVSSQYTRQTYTADTVGLQLSQVLGSRRKWIASLGSSYQRFSYELGGKSLGLDYQYIRGSGSITYQIQRWLSASFGYEIERLTSSQLGNVDYTVNRVTLRMAVGF